MRLDPIRWDIDKVAVGSEGVRLILVIRQALGVLPVCIF